MGEHWRAGDDPADPEATRTNVAYTSGSGTSNTVQGMPGRRLPDEVDEDDPAAPYLAVIEYQRQQLAAHGYALPADLDAPTEAVPVVEPAPARRPRRRDFPGAMAAGMAAETWRRDQRAGLAPGQRPAIAPPAPIEPAPSRRPTAKVVAATVASVLAVAVGALVTSTAFLSTAPEWARFAVVAVLAPIATALAGYWKSP